MDCVLLAAEFSYVCCPSFSSKGPSILKLTSTDGFIGYKELPIGRVKAPCDVSGIARKLEIKL